MVRSKYQISESLPLGILLAVSGGFMDAYSYVCRNKVFANAETGNLILLGIHLSERNYDEARRYLCPVLAFVIGIALAEVSKRLARHLHWQQISVLIEAGILLFVSTLPQSKNLLANSLTSLACGIQVESFRTLLGHGVATTMCIGNLRSGTENLVMYFDTKRKEHLKTGLLYYGVIVFFISGAVIGFSAVMRFHEAAIKTCSLLLMAAFFLMFRENRHS